MTLSRLAPVITVFFLFVLFLYFIFFYLHEKEKKILSGKNFLTGPAVTMSFCLEGEVILSEKGSSMSQVRISHLC